MSEHPATVPVRLRGGSLRSAGYEHGKLETPRPMPAWRRPGRQPNAETLETAERRTDRGQVERWSDRCGSPHWPRPQVPSITMVPDSARISAVSAWDPVPVIPAVVFVEESWKLARETPLRRRDLRESSEDSRAQCRPGRTRPAQPALRTAREPCPVAGAPITWMAHGRPEKGASDTTIDAGEPDRRLRSAQVGQSCHAQKCRPPCDSQEFRDAAYGHG